MVVLGTGLALFAGVFAFWSGKGTLIIPSEKKQAVPLQKLPETAPSASRRIDVAQIADKFKGKDVIQVPLNEKLFALTFDGGGNENGVKEILDILAKERVHSSFFLTGNFMKKFPQAVSAISSGGHEIANHTLSHKNLKEMSAQDAAQEIAGFEEAARAQSVSWAPFFRFPYGTYKKEDIALVNGAGYVAVRWTVDSWGWQGKADGRAAEFVAGRVIEKAVPGGIALMHLGSAKDGSTLDADALADIIRALGAQGYRFVTLSELFTRGL
ncbi:polysaccharide deacetylase family protein [Candidatus Azambacteria bacterium]|nr:polysaccharide deacetylase family protein [Candidatus Azambacteria bacterium]